MFVDYGPTPRICIDFVNNPDLLVGYKNLYDETSRDLSMDYFIAIGANELLDLDDASLTVCLISRDTLGPDSLVQASVGFTTPKVRGQV
jgi:hypothetical protein